ncbi:MAG: hypothetical protein BGO78_01815 [Chloroflexi bacterium 44-23]|nr:MAG: hypothetical protein BGO78_01815 [Chloroflexi bacterium 44-23]
MAVNNENSSFSPENFLSLSASIGNDFNTCDNKDIFQVFQKSLRKIALFFKVDRVILYNLDSEINFSLIEFKSGPFPSHSSWKNSDFSSSLPWVLAQSNSPEPIAIEDLQQLPGTAFTEKLLLEKEKIESILWIPLRNQCQRIAIIEFAEFSRRHSWNSIPTTYYYQLSILFTVLLERKRNIDMTEAIHRSYERLIASKNNELTTIMNIQKVLITELDIKQVIQLIADEVRRLTNSKFSSVCLLENRRMILQVNSGILRGKLPLGGVIEMTNEFSEQALNSGLPFRVKNSPHLPNVYAEALRFLKADSLLVMPLVSEDNLIGMMSIAIKDNGTHRHEDERLVKMFANIAIIAVDNAKSYREQQNRREEAERGKRIAEALRDILRILNSNTAINKILEYIATQSRELLQATSTMIRKIDYEKGTVFTEASSNLPAEFDVIKEIPFYPGGSERILKENVPVAVPNLQEGLGRYLRDTQELSSPQRDWVKVLLKYFKSHLIIPLIINNDLYGTLTFYFDQITDFSEEDIHLAMTLGTQVSLAIENARLRSQEREIAIATERNRLARDLHDAVTQTLFSATLIADALPRMMSKNQTEGLQRLEELRQLTRGALAEMRTLLLELRPSAIQDASFSELLTQLCAAFNSRGNLKVNLKLESVNSLPGEEKLAFYRIAQESLNNIVKHANATHVQINFIEEKTCFILQIHDDGIGFDNLNVPSTHLGIGIMNERAQNIGAKLEIKSSIGHGTEIKLICQKSELFESN